MTIENSYLPYVMTVEKIRTLAPWVKAFTLSFYDEEVKKKFTFLPGQFVIISVIGYGESVLTLTTAPCQLPLTEVAVRSVGNNTRAMHRLKTGDKVMMRGPYGNFFNVAKMKDREVNIIAGGIGLAPLHSLVKAVEKEPKIVGNLRIFAGAKTAEDLIFKDTLKKGSDFADVFLTIDKNDKDWRGNIGTVTDLVKKTKVSHDSIALVCGPPVMFESVIGELEKQGVTDDNIYLMLERRMKCGIGKCQHCTCGDKYVCKDGPTFAWSEIKNNWEIFS